MSTVKWKFVIVMLVITSTALFTKCTPTNQQTSFTVTPTQVLSRESNESSSAISTEISVESLTVETTSTKTPIPNETLAVIHPTESALSVTPEPKPAPSITPSTVDLTNQLFMFVSDTGFHYSWLDLTTNRLEEAEISNYGIPSDSVGSAATLAFSHFSNQVAFWFRNPGEPGTLWLADIELKEPELIYVDNDEVFTSNDSFPPKDVTINWFPNDKYLLLKSTNPNVSNIFVDTSTNSYQENWLWNCNTVITSPKTSQLALLCANNGEKSVMEWGGEIWTTPNISDDNILWEWEDDYMLPLSPSGSIPPWSSDGTKIAFVLLDEPNTLEIITNSNESLSVKFEVDALFPHTIRWIDDGKILVGGYKEDWPASWFIIDSNTGQLLWSLEETSGFDLSPQQQAEQLLLKGEISISGEDLILSTNRVDIPSGNQLLLVDIKNNQYMGVIADIGHGLDAYVWGR